MTATAESEFNALQAALLVTGQEAVKQAHDGKFYPFGAELSGGDTIKLVAPEPKANQTDIEQPLWKCWDTFDNASMMKLFALSGSASW